MVNYIFYDGFESGIDQYDFPAWSSKSGMPTRQDSIVHHGSYAAHIPVGDKLYGIFEDTDSINVRVYVRWISTPSNGNEARLFNIGHTDGTGTLVTARIVNDSGTMKWGLRTLNSGETYVSNEFTTGPTPTSGTWYCVELIWEKNTAYGASIYVDGKLVGTTTATTADRQADSLNLWLESYEIYGYYDCACIAEGYIGPDIEDLTVNGELFIPCQDFVNLSNLEITDSIFGWTTAFVQGVANQTDQYITVNDGSLFNIGDQIVIHDDDYIQEPFIERHTIIGKNDSILQLSSPLSHTYSQAANAVVDKWTPNGFTLPENRIQLGDDFNGNNTSLFLVRDSDTTAPLFTVDQGIVVQKDLAVGGFLGTNQGEVWIGHGRDYASDPPKILLMHSGSAIAGNATGNFVPLVSTYGFYVGDVVIIKDETNSETKIVQALDDNPVGIYLTTNLATNYTSGDVYNYDTLHIERLDGSLANMKLGTMIATQLDIPAQHDVFSVIALDNGPDTDVYLVPQNPSNDTGLGLGALASPFKWVDAENLFADTLNGLTDVDLTITPNAGRKVVIDGDLQVNGDLSSGTLKGSNTTDSNGERTVNFAESFDSAPLVFVQSRDSTGRGVRFDVTSKSTSSFTVKATVLPVNHKHKIGQALATVDWTMGIDNSTGEHKHGFDGVAAVDLAHNHGNHQHGFGSGAEQAAVDLAHNHGTHQHGFGSGAEQAAVDLAHSHGNHQHGFGAGNQAAAVDLTHSHGSHSHGFSGSGGTTSNGSHAHASAGSHSHGMTGTGVQTGITSGHSHLYYVVSGWTTSAGGSHSHASAGSHSHTCSASGTTGSTGVSLGSTISYVGGNTAFSTISLGQSLATVGGNTAYTGVSLGQSLSTVGGNTAFTGINIGETFAYVGGYTKEDAAHGHDLSNKAPYARSIQLRDMNGSVVEAGGTMTTVSDTLKQLYTEAADLSAESLEVDFDWMAIPA
ncbi:MAG: hypothetical protein IAX21_06125 [Candidatus Bathyarchaeota archaeon]|nr:MAG: hypothetical protein IAX21_06125 [Candidatus Bathyarchaeota archaeon]